MRELYDARIRERMYSCELDCGIELYVHPKAHARNSFLMLAVDYGSFDAALPGNPQPPSQSTAVGGPPGVAHFLEHRLFEKEAGDMSETFAALGLDIDAQTTFTHTGYSVSGSGNPGQATELLLELALDLYVTDEGVERERQVIEREIELFGDSVEWVCFSNALRALYPGHPLALDIAGTTDSLQQIDPQTLTSCHQSNYVPDRVSVYASGAVDPHELRRVLNSQLCNRNCVRPDGPELVRVPPHARPGRALSHLAIVRPRAYLLFHEGECGIHGMELLKKELCLELTCDILFGPASEFFSRHYEAGQIEAESFDWEIYAEPAFVFVSIGGDVTDAGEFEEAVLGELGKARGSDIIRAGFDRAMRKAFGHLLCGYEDIENCVVMAHSAVSRKAEPFDFARALDQITPDDVERCLTTCFQSEHCAVSVVEPSCKIPNA